MTRVALLASVLALTTAGAQDSLAPRGAAGLDVARLHPFSRTYDVVVRTGDSTVALGERTVRADTTRYAGSPAWVLSDTRSGAVPVAETLFVAPDLRPLHWSGTMGPAHLATEFVGDSLIGAMSAGAWKQNIVLPVRSGTIVNGAMLETMLPMLPLAETWVDSTAIVLLTLTTARLIPAQLAVLASVDIPLDSLASSPAWIVALRTADDAAVYWVEKGTGVLLRMEQPVPSHVGWRMEYRLRRQDAARTAR